MREKKPKYGTSDRLGWLGRYAGIYRCLPLGRSGENTWRSVKDRVGICWFLSCKNHQCVFVWGPSPTAPKIEGPSGQGKSVPLNCRTTGTVERATYREMRIIVMLKNTIPYSMHIYWYRNDSMCSSPSDNVLSSSFPDGLHQCSKMRWVRKSMHRRICSQGWTY
jgi:hypothetical protein